MRRTKREVGLNGSRAAGATHQSRAGDRPPADDPVTSERLYSAEELEWLRAADVYRMRYAKRFLNACDYFHVCKSIGYTKGP